MLKFSEFINKNILESILINKDRLGEEDEKKINWLDWDASRRNRSNLTEVINIWDTWNDSLKLNQTHIKTNKHGHQYDSYFHDNPDIMPKDHDQQILPLEYYSDYKPKVSSASSESINTSLRKIANPQNPLLLQSNNGKSITKLSSTQKNAINNLKNTFTPENTNRIPIQVYAGIPKHIGEKLENSKIGSFHYNPGFQSASSDPRIARNFGSEYFETNPNSEFYRVIHYYAHPGIARSIAHHSHFAENEVLIHHGAKMEYQGFHDTVAHNKHPLRIYKMIVHNKFIPLDSY